MQQYPNAGSNYICVLMQINPIIMFNLIYLLFCFIYYATTFSFNIIFFQKNNIILIYAFE